MRMHLKPRPLLFLPLSLFCAAHVYSAPFIPATDATMPEHLPLKAGNPTTRELRQYSHNLDSALTDLELAVRLDPHHSTAWSGAYAVLCCRDFKKETI